MKGELILGSDFQNCFIHTNVKMCQNKLYLTNIYSVPIICQVVEKVNPFLPTFLYFSLEDNILHFYSLSHALFTSFIILLHSNNTWFLKLATFYQNVWLLCLGYEAYLQSLSYFVPPIKQAHLGRARPYPVLFFGLFSDIHHNRVKRWCQNLLSRLVYLIVRKGKENAAEIVISSSCLWKLCTRRDCVLPQHLIKWYFASTWLLFFENSFLIRELLKIKRVKW